MKMATTKIWRVHTRIDNLVEYAANPEKTSNMVFDDIKGVLEYAEDEAKTEQKLFVGGVNCNPETAASAMNAVLASSVKKPKIVGYHAYQSFAEGETNAEQAFEIGMKLAEELWGDKFQVVVATHCNTNHYHNHFVLCATSFIDGSRYHHCKETQNKMRGVSDRLCREYGLSVVENESPNRTKHYAEWNAEKNGNITWRELIKADIDKAISESMTDKQFYFKLKQMGYRCKTGKDISVTAPGRQRGFRLARNLGEDYTADAINERILSNVINKRRETEVRSPNKVLKLTQPLKRKSGIGGLRGLYYHYCYRLGIIGRKRQSPAQVRFIMRDDLFRLDKIQAETKLLARNNIDTDDELATHRAGLEQEHKQIAIARKKLRNEVRRALPEEDVSVLKQMIKKQTVDLAKLRKEIKLCDGIAERSIEMRGKLNEIEKEKREEEKYESRIRRNEPNRENDFGRSGGRS